MNETPTLNGILNTDNVSSQVQILTNVLTKCIDECAPIVTKVITRPPKPWITNNIKQNIIIRDKLQNDIKKDRNNTILRNNFKEKKKEVKIEMDNSMKEHYRDELRSNKNNLRTSWKKVRSILPNNTNKESQIENEDLTDKAEKFNEYFANIGRKTYERTQEELSRNNRSAQTDEINTFPNNRLYSFKPSPIDCDTVILSQHGFRPKLSTETALLKISDKIYDNIDKKKISLLLLLDLSKAFDSVNHEILLSKCQTLYIEPSWFTDHLRNRVQSVRLKNVVSTPKNVGFGVPKGSILGPLLFNTYVNDLRIFLSDCFIVQYADDTQIIIDGYIDNLEDLVRKAEEILYRVKMYFQINGLLLNESKTQCIFLGSRQYLSEIGDNIKINFKGAIIEPMESVKNLGVHFDKHMTFEKHIDELHRKVMGTLIYLNRLKNLFEPETRLIVVQSTVDLVTGMTTKQANNLVSRRANTHIGSREINTKGPQLWNSLPGSLKDEESLRSFKNKLRKHLLNNN
ncbi:uncharacterized protein [Palaemon carinicauda]|uniref:uncharacterized protein n=1 Tax=Palaemon carinicauda TaxID=392227 RepID=UPI0035B67020